MGKLSNRELVILSGQANFVREGEMPQPTLVFRFMSDKEISEMEKGHKRAVANLAGFINKDENEQIL